MSTNHDLQAGRLILAVADGNTATIGDVLREVAPRPWELLGLVTALASVAIESARVLAGDEWQDVMRTALNAIEIEDIEKEVEPMNDSETDNRVSTSLVPDLQPADHARAARAALAYRRGDRSTLDSTLDAANAEPGGVATLLFALLAQLDATARAFAPERYDQLLAKLADECDTDQ